MSNFIDFDVKEYEEIKEITILPENQYVFKITSCSLQENKWSPGTRSIKIELTCFEPGCHGVKVMDFINIEHEDEEKRKKARARVRAISTVTNTEEELSKAKDISVLMGKEVGADIKIKVTDKGKYNNVYYYIRPENIIKNTVIVQNKPASVINDQANNPNDDIPF